jgi:hypothetical protein
MSRLSPLIGHFIGRVLRDTRHRLRRERRPYAGKVPVTGSAYGIGAKRALDRDMNDGGLDRSTVAWHGCRGQPRAADFHRRGSDADDDPAPGGRPLVGKAVGAVLLLHAHLSHRGGDVGRVWNC